VEKLVLTIKEIAERWNTNEASVVLLIARGELKTNVKWNDNGTMTHPPMISTELLRGRLSHSPASQSTEDRVSWLLKHGDGIYALIEDVIKCEKAHPELLTKPEEKTIPHEKTKAVTDETALYGDKAIAKHYGISVNTLRKSYIPDGCPVQTRKGRHYAYPTALNEWRDAGSIGNRRKPKK
jgi:hypothetical protein